MATKRTPPPARDFAEEQNQIVLAGIERRNQERQDAAAEIDLGLGLKSKEPETAAEFLADAWDKKNFGTPLPTYTRIVYGPDPLLQSAPEMKARIEAMGLERYAAATADAILLKEENAVPDPVLRKGLRLAIRQFGKEAVAKAFGDRIMKIPVREVQIEAEREDELFGKPLDDAVARYGVPGMAVKFLSERCIAVLGLRGYEIVNDEKGDPVKVGTLLMGVIPQRVADRRRAHFVEESLATLREAEAGYRDQAEREIHNAKAAGLSPLRGDDIVRAGASETLDYLGDTRATGFHIEHQN